MGKDESAVTSTQSFWVGEIETYEQQFGPWEKRSKKIIDRFMDERDDSQKTVARFNILWSNIQTLQPAIYASPPTPNIDRRFDNDDDAGRYSALVLERSVSYYVKNDLFDKVMKQTTLDRLLCGRGSSWVRYCPVFEEKIQVTDDEQDKDYDQPDDLVTEDTVPDYVHWQDFGHTWGRTWQEVRGVWRRVYMSRAELVKRFGEKGQTVPLDAVIKGKNDESLNAGKKAVIYEIWDKSTKKALWIHKAEKDVLDEVEDPLGLKDFFPCPEPVYSTLSNNSLIPTPDYAQYQDQAIELDLLTARIAAITKAIKVAGVYDASAQGIDRLLSEGVENKLIPVEQWAVLGGGKGLEGVISLFPLDEIMATLTGLYAAREQVKQDLYEITGISDIVRGQGKANETATAQEIKGQFATLRLDNNQKDIARFAKDLVVIMTEVIAKHFSLDTIKQVSGVKLLTEVEKQQIQMQMQQAEQMAMQAQQTGQPPPPPIPEEIQELMELPTWEEIEGIIRNDTARNFRIDIETDSTIKTDQENEKKARTEFLAAAGGFIQQMVLIPNPELQPLLMEMLMFGIKGFKVSRELETTFDNAISKIKKAAENPAPTPPNPEAEAAKAAEQAKMIETQGKMQIEGKKLEMQTNKDSVEYQVKSAEISLKEKEIQLKEADLMQRQQEKSIDAQLERERIHADILIAAMSGGENTGEEDSPEINPTDMITQAIQKISDIQAQTNEAIAAAMGQNNQAIVEAMNRPKTVVRDKQGNLIGVK